MSVADADLPRPFGPYLLLAQLARGGMGEVYFAKHGGLQGFEKHCVVKTLRNELAAQDDYVARFTEEARVVVQLSHRNVCPVFDVGRADGQLYLAMEHLIGRDLRSLQGRLGTALAVHVVGEVLEALDYAHRFIDAETEEPLGIVHRDVSPHNVILGVEGDVKLIDFGIATTAKSGPVNEGSVVLGKLGYMAPEHARGDEVDGRADQYAAAVLLTELLTGGSFLDGLSREQAWRMAGTGGHRPAAFASLDEALRAILDRALDAQRDRRFPSCAAFGDAVVAWARERGHVADARDVRRLMTGACPKLPAEVRALARAFAQQRAPDHELAARTPGFETIATTMMVAPTTAGFHGAEPPPTLLVRDRAASAPKPRVPAAAAMAAAVVAALALGAAGMAVVVGAGAAERELQQEVIALPSSPLEEPELVEPTAPGPSDDADDAAGDAEVDAADDATPTSAAPEPPRARVERRPRPRKSARISADGRHDLAFLASSCVGKVPCAAPVVEWSRARLTSADAAELARAAKDCARKCRLR